MSPAANERPESGQLWDLDWNDQQQLPHIPHSSQNGEADRLRLHERLVCKLWHAAASARAQRATSHDGYVLQWKADAGMFGLAFSSLKHRHKAVPISAALDPSAQLAA